MNSAPRNWIVDLVKLFDDGSHGQSISGNELAHYLGLVASDLHEMVQAIKRVRHYAPYFWIEKDRSGFSYRFRLDEALTVALIAIHGDQLRSVTASIFELVNHLEAAGE